MPDSRPWPALLLFCLTALGVALLVKAAWIIAFVVIAVFAASAIIIIARNKASRDMAILAQISQPGPPDGSILAYRMLAQIDLSAIEKKPLAVRASEIIRDDIKLERFAIFFRENDKYIPRICSGVSKGDLASPFVQKLGPTLRNDIQNGALSRNESDSLPAFKRISHNVGASTVAFAYSWSRVRSVYIVGDDPLGKFSEISTDGEFNRIFWPGLENALRLNQMLHDRNRETRDLSVQLELARKEVNEVNRELKSKLLDLKGFVNISNELFSLFDEGGLFEKVKAIVCERLGAASAEILLPSGDGNYIPREKRDPDNPDTVLMLDSVSELAELISNSSRPILLPIAGSGLKQNEPFLRAALNANYQIASAIRAGGQTACILLAAQKSDKSHFTSQDLDFLNIICNIASLSLENIHQYSTIEKLSYTDSMTGIYNYRYFYKRLNEEILRAKRYDRELALVILDIDNFKSFNDNYGHQAGDLVLKQLSDLITKTIRSIDVVSRYGGEEFCIIMPDTNIGNCEVFIERLRSQIAEFRFESNLFQRGSSISVSVGGAVYPYHAPSPDRLIYCADMALLKAKALGRNRAVMYELSESFESNSAEGGFNESHQESMH